MDSINIEKKVCDACKHEVAEPVEIKSADGQVAHVLCAECAKADKKCPCPTSDACAPEHQESN